MTTPDKLRRTIAFNSDFKQAIQKIRDRNPHLRTDSAVIAEAIKFRAHFIEHSLSDIINALTLLDYVRRETAAGGRLVLQPHDPSQPKMVVVIPRYV